ncbi:MAG: hypothetical protein DCC49_13435 [Acidobacteria bacterium]|nr:MAG: hypothetical protein DCC49_13435 [Acidobacteriota bacterium]
MRAWRRCLISGLCLVLLALVPGGCSWVISELDSGEEQSKLEQVLGRIGLPFDPSTVSTERPPSDSRGKPNSVTVIATSRQSVPWTDMTATISKWLSNAGFKVELIGTCVVSGGRRDLDSDGEWSVGVQAFPTWGPTKDFRCAGPVNAVKLRLVVQRV